jgi:TorA maturation chaperone TorD
MSGEAAPLQSVPALPAEEAARANFYGLLARLLYAPPDAELLAAIARADEIVAEDEGGRAFALAWRDLKLAAAQSDAAAVADEYDTLFVGTGKAPVSLYAGAYLAKSAVDNPLVEIRGFLAAHGFARRQSIHEPEDHVALLCEVMRHLIAQKQAVLADQQSFFARFLQPCFEPLCNAIERSEHAHLYKQIAMYMRRFLEIEAEAFHM